MNRATFRLMNKSFKKKEKYLFNLFSKIEYNYHIYSPIEQTYVTVNIKISIKITKLDLE